MHTGATVDNRTCHLVGHSVLWPLSPLASNNCLPVLKESDIIGSRFCQSQPSLASFVFSGADLNCFILFYTSSTQLFQLYYLEVKLSNVNEPTCPLGTVRDI